MVNKPADLSIDAAQALLKRMAEHDESALRELHDLYARRIFLFALSRLRDETAAQTVMIDTLFDVWKRPDRFRGESRFSTWLLGIAKYKVLTAFRAAQATHENIDDHADHLEDPGAGVTNAIEAQQDARLLRECVAMLSAPQRECVQLVFFEGLMLQEVAALQDVPEGTVKTRLFHARKNLRKCMQGKQSGGPDELSSRTCR